MKRVRLYFLKFISVFLLIFVVFSYIFTIDSSFCNFEKILKMEIFDLIDLLVNKIHTSLRRRASRVSSNESIYRSLKSACSTLIKCRKRTSNKKRIHKLHLPTLEKN